MFEQLQDSYVQRPDRPKADGQAHETSLGTRRQEGITLYGHRGEFTSTKGDQRTEESWDSDLGIFISNKTAWPSEGKETLVIVSDIRRVDPDLTLFQIPPGYRSFQSPGSNLAKPSATADPPRPSF